jgi:hypothetical protein
MNPLNFIARHFLKILIPLIFILSACSEWIIPNDLPGSYNGKERVIIRYDRGGQYIFLDDYVMVSLIIDKHGNITGMAGDAAFEDCILTQNRGWIGRRLGIKTDFLIKGKLNGSTFEKDTLINKDISIPFNIENGELKGSLFLTTKGDSFPIISVLKLKKW